MQEPISNQDSNQSEDAKKSERSGSETTPLLGASKHKKTLPKSVKTQSKVVVQAAATGTNRLITTFTNLGCFFIIARLGSDELASLPYVSAIHALVNITVLTFQSPSGGKMAALYNRKVPPKKIADMIRETQFMGVLVALPFIPAMYAAPFIINLCGVERSVTNKLFEYFLFRSIALPLDALRVPSQQLFIGTDMKIYALMLNLLTSGLQISFVLMVNFDTFGLRQYGITAIGLTFPVVSLLQLLSNEIVLKLKGYPTTFAALFGRTERSYIWNKGWPVSLQYFLEFSSVVGVSVMTGFLGTEMLRVRGITSLVSSFIMPLIFAFSQGATYSVADVKVKIEKGELSNSQLRKTAYTSILFGSGVVTAMLVALAIDSNWYLSIAGADNYPFSKEDRSLMRKLVLMNASAQMFEAVRNISSGVTKGLNNTRFSSASSVFFRLFLKTALALVLGFVVHLDLIGFASSNIISLALESILIFTYMHYSTQAMHWALTGEESHKGYLGEVKDEFLGLASYIKSIFCCREPTSQISSRASFFHIQGSVNDLSTIRNYSQTRNDEQTHGDNQMQDDNDDEDINFDLKQ